MFYRLRKRLAKRFAVLILFSGSILSFSSINSEELNIITIDEYIKDKEMFNSLMLEYKKIINEIQILVYEKYV